MFDKLVHFNELNIKFENISFDEGYEKISTAGKMYELGKSYYDKKDYETAVKWFKKSADLDNADSINKLGDCYYYGYGLEIDEKKVVELYKKSANAGNDDAMYSLGYCYHRGRGVEPDHKKADEWLRKAKDKGNKWAIRDYGLFSW